MQENKLVVSLYMILEVIAYVVSALPISTASYGATLARCVPCEGGRPAGPWQGGEETGSGEGVGEERLADLQAAKLDTLLRHINTTLHICQSRSYDADATPGPRFVDYNLPPSHSVCPNKHVPLLDYTQELMSTLASYATLLQQMALTEADYQTEVTDPDPSFSLLAAHTQSAGCGVGLYLGRGRLCDPRPHPSHTTGLDYLVRFWWDLRIVSNVGLYVDSARQCLRHWETRQ